MKYKVGDRVKVKSLQWFNENSDEKYKVVLADGWYFSKPMSILCGKELTIKKISHAANPPYYIMEDNTFAWTDEMIEGLVEEDNVYSQWSGLKVELELSQSIIGVSNVESIHGERFMSGFVKAIIPPEGYIFKDENGNVINATKIVLEKKKKEYPKTYEKCCKVIGVSRHDVEIGLPQPYQQNMFNLFKLLICRDTYWKLYGEEMGLGKPWEYDCNSEYFAPAIIYRNGCIQKVEVQYRNAILAFPTKEMRDAFYENFKEEIEICKELL